MIPPYHLFCQNLEATRRSYRRDRINCYDWLIASAVNKNKWDLSFENFKRLHYESARSEKSESSISNYVGYWTLSKLKFYWLEPCDIYWLLLWLSKITSDLKLNSNSFISVRSVAEFTTKTNPQMWIINGWTRWLGKCFGYIIQKFSSIKCRVFVAKCTDLKNQCWPR